MRLPAWAALGLLAAYGSSGSNARADDCVPRQSDGGLSPCIDSDALWAKPGNARFLATGSNSTTPAGEVAITTVVSYMRRPYRLEIPGPSLEPRDVYVIENALDTTYLLALGVTDRLELTLAVPVTFYQDGA